VDLARAYQVLEVKPGVSAWQARRQFRLKAKKWHPDRYPNEPAAQLEAAERFKEINEAYRSIRRAALGPPLIHHDRHSTSEPSSSSLPVRRTNKSPGHTAARFLWGFGIGILVSAALLPLVGTLTVGLLGGGLLLLFDEEMSALLERIPWWLAALIDMF